MFDHMQFLNTMQSQVQRSLIGHNAVLGFDMVSGIMKSRPYAIMQFSSTCNSWAQCSFGHMQSQARCNSGTCNLRAKCNLDICIRAHCILRVDVIFGHNSYWGHEVSWTYACWKDRMSFVGLKRGMLILQWCWSCLFIFTCIFCI